jgi:radical SAM protein with 4Fe4S-binding SPASM domain
LERAVELRNYGEFSAAIQGRGTAARVPMNVTFEVTRRCPLACSHCYNNLPVGDRTARASEMTFDEHRRLLDELADLGALWLLYTGGEIFARQDFLDIYTYARGKGFLITLFTNGTMITPAIADHLARHRPFAIEITLYGATRETYEKLTGVAGSYDRCMRGIQLLLERNLPLRLKTVAVTVNKHELDDMRRLAEGLGVEFKLDAMMSPRIDCSQSPLEVRLLPEEVVELDVRDDKRMAEWGLFAQLHLGEKQQQHQDDRVYQCGGGINSFAVDPMGGMSICVLSQNDKFDLHGGSVREGWEQFLRKVRDRKVSRATKCTDCGLKSLCGMCPANGELENSDPEAPVDFLCQVAHLRAYTFGFPVPAHGDCECCPTGSAHPQLDAWAQRLRKVAPGAPLTQRRPRALALVAEKAASAESCGGGCATCR